MEKMLGNKKYILIFILPALLLFLGFTLIPLITSGVYSFFEYNGIGSKTFIGIKNYIELFTSDRYFPQAVKNSLILVAASLFIQLPISLILALILSKGVKGDNFFRTIYFIPVVISSMVIGQLWLKMFNSDYGVINTVIRYFVPEYEHSWLTKNAFMTVLIPSVWQYIGYHMIIFYAGIKSISTDYYEAAQIDGASTWQVYRKITLPLLVPVIKTCVIFAITGSLRAFDLVYVMTGGGPNHISEVPATLMYNNLFRKGLYGYGSAQAFFIVIECLIFTFIVNRLFKKAEQNVSAVQEGTMKKKNIIGKIKFIVLLLIALTQLFPLYWLITFSLKSNTEIFGENVIGLPKVWRWDNYITALSSSNLIRYFLNSVFYSVVTVVVAGIISSMAAYAIARMTWKLKNAVYGLFMIGIMIPAQAALLPLFQILDTLGLKGGYLGLIIPYIAGALPMSIMILVGFYRGIPREMEEAAYIDGCGIFKCFIQIIFPMVKPAIATASIFTFLGTWNELMLANTFVDSDQYRTLPVGIMSLAGQYSTEWGLIGAGMVIATLPTIIIYFFLSKQVQESLVVGAVKG